MIVSMRGFYCVCKSRWLAGGRNKLSSLVAGDRTLKAKTKKVKCNKLFQNFVKPEIPITTIPSKYTILVGCSCLQKEETGEKELV